MRRAAETEDQMFFGMGAIRLDHYGQFIEIRGGSTVQTGVEKRKRFKMDVGIGKCGNHAFAAQVFNRDIRVNVRHGVSGMDDSAVVRDQCVKYAVVVLTGDKIRICKNFHVHPFLGTNTLGVEMSVKIVSDKPQYKNINCLSIYELHVRDGFHALI